MLVPRLRIGFTGSKALPWNPLPCQALRAVSSVIGVSIDLRSEAEPREQCVPRQSLGTRKETALAHVRLKPNFQHIMGSNPQENVSFVELIGSCTKK